MTDARARIHAMFPLDEAATTELDQRLDALVVEALVKAGVQYVDCPACGAAQPVGGECGNCAFKARMAAELAERGLATAEAASATPTDINRRARLLHEMALGARWKSGDVVAWYETQGLTGLDARAARHDLAVLCDSGAITQHDDRGVRYYTLNTRKDVRP
jgi:hypothetical protein